MNQICDQASIVFDGSSTRSAQPSWCCSFAHTQESPASPLLPRHHRSECCDDSFRMDSRTQQSSLWSIININDGVLVRHRCRPRSLGCDRRQRHQFQKPSLGSSTEVSSPKPSCSSVSDSTNGCNILASDAGMTTSTAEKVYLVAQPCCRSGVLAWFIYFKVARQLSRALRPCLIQTATAVTAGGVRCLAP